MEKKLVRFRIPEETYFRLLELKARFRARNWTDFIEKLLEDKEVKP